MTTPLPEHLRVLMNDPSTDRKQAVKMVSNADLAVMARHWMDHVTMPDDGSPGYETTLLHAILPEMLNRIEDWDMGSITLTRCAQTGKITINERDLDVRDVLCSIEVVQGFVDDHNNLIDARQPVPMILNCPSCGERHIDEEEFATKPHHTHACQNCGMVWRPAKVDTVGVRFLPGYKNDTV